MIGGLGAAIGNAGLNIYNNETHVLGYDLEKDNYFRGAGESLLGGAKKVFDGAMSFVTGDKPAPDAAKGEVDDRPIDLRPAGADVKL
jgi:hypothetical protein